MRITLPSQEDVTMTKQLKLRKAIVLFGPPGCGKSTLVQEAADLGFKTRDLESTTTEINDGRETRFVTHIPSDARSLDIIGAAAAQPGQFSPRDFVRVLILPPRSVYDARRQARDAARPGKAGQSDVWQAFANGASAFDFVFPNDGLPGQELIRLLEMTRQLRNRDT